MVRDYPIISCDAHLEMAPEAWTKRIPAKHRDRGPRRIRLENGGDATLVENRPLRVCGLDLCGKPYEEYQPTGVTYEGSPGAGPPEQRIAEQDKDGVDAEILFPGVGGPVFWRGISNDQSYRAVIHAYNEFLVEDYCVVAPNRLIGLGLMPETGLTDARTELAYCAENGLKGVVLNAWPTGKTYPTEEDDLFWQDAINAGIAVTVHVVLRHTGGARSGPGLRYPIDLIGQDVQRAGVDPVKRIASFGMGGSLNAAQLLFGGTFERIPELQIYFAENQIGWIPQFYEQLDMLYDRNIHWSNRYFGLQPLERRPSEYLKEHIYWGFMNNPVGVKYRQDVGVKHVMWGADFPHSDCDWPRSQEVIADIFGGVAEDEQQMMLSTNAIEFFHLDDTGSTT